MAPRSYNQACAIAGALDLLGERWTLLIVRDLLTGPLRYTDLLQRLDGIGTNLLAKRLQTLRRRGVVAQRELPAPAWSTVYELTPMGRELEPALYALARWGLRHGLAPAGAEAIHEPGWWVLALKAAFRPERGAELALACNFHVDGRAFYAAVDRGSLETGAGSLASPDVVVHTTKAATRALETGEADLVALIRSGTLTIEGDPAQFHALMACFDPATPPR